jgi:hypothetical protein
MSDLKSEHMLECSFNGGNTPFYSYLTKSENVKPGDTVFVRNPEGVIRSVFVAAVRKNPRLLPGVNYKYIVARKVVTKSVLIELKEKIPEEYHSVLDELLG